MDSISSGVYQIINDECLPNMRYLKRVVIGEVTEITAHGAIVRVEYPATNDLGEFTGYYRPSELVKYEEG